MIAAFGKLKTIQFSWSWVIRPFIVTLRYYIINYNPSSGLSELVSLVRPWLDHFWYKQIPQSKVIEIYIYIYIASYLPCDEKLMMLIVLSYCQSAASCVLFIDIPFCEETVLPLTTFLVLVTKYPNVNFCKGISFAF